MARRRKDKQARAPPAGLPVQCRPEQKQMGPLAREDWVGQGRRGWGAHLPHLPGEAELQKQGSARSQRMLSGTPEGHHLHRKAGEMLIHLLRRSSRYRRRDIHK